MTISIEKFRLTFLWTETVVKHFEDGVGVGENHPASFLRHDGSYQKAFPKLVSSDDNVLGLSHPWPHRGGQKFWIHYLDGQPLDHLSGKQALRALVPLRRRVSLKLGADWFNTGTSVNVECFVFPHGSVIALTFAHAQATGLGDFADFIFRVRRMTYDVLQDDGTSQRASINVLAERLMNEMRDEMFGQNMIVSRRSTSPFTIFSVIKATGVDSEATFPPDPEVQRILDVAAAWRPTFKVNPLAPIETVRINTRTGPISHILYGRKRGRAVWFPAMFDIPNIRTVSCYHRNLVFSAAQTESLGQLVTETAAQSAGPMNPHPYHERLCRWACGLLGRMYAGAPSTYRSNSIKAHIHDNFADSLASMRDRYGMRPGAF